MVEGFYWCPGAAKVMAHLIFRLIMSGRYFFVSFLITLLVLPTFAYSQSKTESKIIVEDETTKGSSESETSSRQFISREHTVGQDAIDVLKLSGTGFLNQFTNWDSVLLLGATGGMTYMLSLDEMHQQQVIQRVNVMGVYGQKVGDINGLMLSIPIIQAGGYFLGRALNNEKLTQFSMDVTATHILVLLEVGAISQIPFHQRPNVARGLEAERSGGINDVLRGASSFPSGHMVGISVLMFKSWEYYGWRAGIPATIAAALIGWARIEAGDHYLTDIFGAVALTGIASLSTSRKFDIVTRGITTSDGGRFVVKPVIGTNNLGVSVTRTF
jgi:membrane-associated phospholipid phosphatase